MRVVDLIRRKRDAAELTPEEIRFLITGYTRGDIPDYQMSAWLMAAFLRGLNGAETAALTDAMLHSGKVLDFSDMPGRKVDKHSTGGVGDKTSLIIAPIVAAAGVRVPMISGRGLGHTGGTLDKLESIPGFSVNLSLAEFRHALETVGCALIGQTAEIAPADKKMYALRDVTGTVESRSLICASIMSKKLAEGIDALVLDVKVGSGAFLKTEADATLLAELMVETGRRMGKQVVALLTDMDQPLGRTAGNAMEVQESIEVLAGGGPADLRELCLALAAWMLLFGERVKNVEEGKGVAAELIASGRAREKFREIVRQQGGDARVVDDPKLLRPAAHTLDVVAAADGYVAATQCEQLGVAVVVLGGGREKKEDSVDPAVGLVFHKRNGDRVARGEPLCTLHYNSDARLDEARRLVETAYIISQRPPAAGRPLVGRVIGG
ncbi:MAG: thymidine phosphorylase [Candidatus Acidiferrales bacterium]